MLHNFHKSCIKTTDDLTDELTDELTDDLSKVCNYIV